MKHSRLFSSIAILLLSTLEGGAAEKLTTKEIDARMAEFIRDAPADYLEQRELIEQRIDPFLAQRSTAELRGLLDRLEPDGNLKMRHLRSVATRLGELEGASGVEFTWEHPRSIVRNQRESALGGWAGVDGEAALDWTLARAGEGRILRELVDSIVRRDPEQAEALLTHPALKDSAAREKGLITLGRQTIRDNPRAALEWLTSLPEQDLIPVALELLDSLSTPLPEETARLLPTLPRPVQQRWHMTAIGNWALTDPPAAFAWAGKLPEARMRRNGRWITLAIWSDIDPLPAWKSLLALAPGDLEPLLEMRSALYRGYLETGGRGGAYNRNSVFHSGIPFGFQQPESDRPQIASMVGYHYRGMARAIPGELLVEVMTPRIPDELLDDVLALAEDSPHEELAATLETTRTQRRTRKNPSAMKDLATLPGQEQRAADAIRTFGFSDPAAALALADTLTEHRESTISAIVRNWIRFEEGEAHAHIEGLAGGALKTTALEAERSARSTLATRNRPVEARRAFEALPLGSIERNRAFNHYLSLVLDQGTTPVETIYRTIDAHFETQTFDPRTNPLTHDIVPKLLKRDPEALARWAAKTLPESNLRYRALRSFWEHWEKHGEGEGVKRLTELGIAEKEIRSSRY